MSDAYSVIYSPKARSAIKEIYSYIAFELLVPDTAEGQVNRIRKRSVLLTLCHHEQLSELSMVAEISRAWYHKHIMTKCKRDSLNAVPFCT